MNPSGVNRSRQKVFKESKLVATKMNNKDLANELGTVKDWVNPLVTRRSCTRLEGTRSRRRRYRQSGTFRLAALSQAVLTPTLVWLYCSEAA